MTETERLIVQNQVVIMDALIALLQASVSGRTQRQQLERQCQRSAEHVMAPRHSMVGP